MFLARRSLWFVCDVRDTAVVNLAADVYAEHFSARLVPIVLIVRVGRLPTVHILRQATMDPLLLPRLARILARVRRWRRKGEQARSRRWWPTLYPAATSLETPGLSDTYWYMPARPLWSKFWLQNVWKIFFFLYVCVCVCICVYVFRVGRHSGARTRPDPV